MSKGRWAAPADAELVKSMFGAVGKIHEVEEKLLDAVTGLRYAERSDCALSMQCSVRVWAAGGTECHRAMQPSQPGG